MLADVGAEMRASDTLTHTRGHACFTGPRGFRPAGRPGHQYTTQPQACHSEDKIPFLLSFIASLGQMHLERDVGHDRVCLGWLGY